MSSLPARSVSAPEQGPAAAIRFLATRGYDATTAEHLADAVGMSRSTFFRRFGSKEDVIFADHDTLLTELTALLAGTAQDPASAVITGTRRILDHHLAQADTTRLRAEILRESPALRDRELVIGHRYEQVFAAYLTAHTQLLPWEVLALSASIVAIHNATLRHWLRDASWPASRNLERDLTQLTQRFLRPGADDSTVMVTVYRGADAATVLANVQSALDAQ
ncbi:AcrR family transcriptional regulator [Leucobacter exalbidus]|uniref:AcrR family transcriptional regulator n=1 Tax=Leucobacter exalbidus TaxID=662960 RepID=A0A940T3A5_9MICO|nr:TetR/AcrR family transcriptional regulator [Leucobacter exalbidus]MBP1325623.1 AcrR family transcriptional regulator [Leucobacter exalbidus]